MSVPILREKQEINKIQREVSKDEEMGILLNERQVEQLLRFISTSEKITNRVTIEITGSRLTLQSSDSHLTTTIGLELRDNVKTEPSNNLSRLVHTNIDDIKRKEAIWGQSRLSIYIDHHMSITLTANNNESLMFKHINDIGMDEYHLSDNSIPSLRYSRIKRYYLNKTALGICIGANPTVFTSDGSVLTVRTSNTLSGNIYTINIQHPDDLYHTIGAVIIVSKYMHLFLTNIQEEDIQWTIENKKHLTLMIQPDNNSSYYLTMTQQTRALQSDHKLNQYEFH